jgi:hypothetical protein
MGSALRLPEQTVCLPGVTVLSVCYATLGAVLDTILSVRLSFRTVCTTLPGMAGAYRGRTASDQSTLFFLLRI